MHPSPNSPSDEDLESFEDLIGYRFRGRILAREALQITNALPGEGNKSLAMFGDAVLRMILIWQGRQQNQSERKQICSSIHFLNNSH
jgi:ribonuclease-3